MTEVFGLERVFSFWDQFIHQALKEHAETCRKFFRDSSFAPGGGAERRSARASAAGPYA
jgi:hypothetical protein